ncbi:hypothetical protein LV779_25615 [Streptomyces thinghirensis]|nr:hypothetical protein [Streptomyces thinghirensis]
MVPLHSLEADNVAHVVQPKAFSFSMAVKAIGPAVAKLTDIALTHKSFNIGLQEASGSDWTFQQILFNDCYITSAASTILVDGVPTTTFSCVSSASHPHQAPEPAACGGPHVAPGIRATGRPARSWDRSPSWSPVGGRTHFHFPSRWSWRETSPRRPARISSRESTRPLHDALS